MISVNIVRRENNSSCMLDVDPSFTFELLRDLAACDLKLNENEVYTFTHKGRNVKYEDSLAVVGVRDKDLILVKKSRVAPAVVPAVVPAPTKEDEKRLFVQRRLQGMASITGRSLESRFDDEARQLISSIAEDPRVLERLSLHKPAVGEALATRNHGTVVAALRRELELGIERTFEEEWALRQAYMHPDTAESQAVIMKKIQQDKVSEQYHLAMEYLPELYSPVCMLYVNCRLNKKDAIAFVDTGAQVSLISERFARESGLHDLIDTSFSGVASGVGLGRILGKIHMVDLSLGSKHVQVSFSVMEEDNMEFLLGLDIMKRYRMLLDLNRNGLVVDDECVPFLSEADVDARVTRRNNF